MRKAKFEKKQKLKKILIPIISCFAVISVLYNVFFLINTTIYGKKFVDLFGISLFCMDTDLMEDEIGKYDLVVTKKVLQSEIKKDDIIAYEVNGNVRINKVVAEEEGYITKFNKNYYPDLEKISINQIVGKKIATFPIMGLLLNILQSRFISIFILIILILFFVYNNFKYKKAKERRTITKCHSLD